jgi:hypothetical protein
MAAWGATIGTFTTSTYEHSGVPVDNIGGPTAIFLALLAYQVVFCTVGSVAGYLLWRFVNKNEALSRQENKVVVSSLLPAATKRAHSGEAREWVDKGGSTGLV